MAAAVAAGVYFAVTSGGGRKPEVTEAPKSSSAVDVLKAANTVTELTRTKDELALANARLAASQAIPASSGAAAPAPAADLSQPPAGGLVMWFDASKGTRADAAGTASVQNGPAGQWQDRAANGGLAVFQYTSSSTKNKEENFPLLRNAPAGAGLIAARPVIAFDGKGDTLCVRDRDRVGDPVGDSLNGGNFSVFVVFKSGGSDAPEGLISARTDKKQTLWSMGVRQNGLSGGPAKHKVIQIPGSEGEFRIGSIVIDAAAGMSRLGLISSDGRRESEEQKMTVDTAAKPEMIRMGTSDGSANQQRSEFGGDIAEVLIYNRALDRDSRHLTEDYLRQKFFGLQNPAVTSRGK